MYLVVIAVLSILLAFDAPPYALLRADGWIIAAVAGVTIAPALVAALTSRRALRQLNAHPDDPSYGQAALARGMTLVQTLLGVGHSALLAGTDWLRICRQTPWVGDWLVVPTLLAGVPFVVGVLLVWISLYPAERAIRQIALEINLMRGRPVHPVWSIWEYLAYNFRHQLLFILAPMLLILLARDVIDDNLEPIRRASGMPFLPDLLLGSAAGLVAVIAPALLRYIWLTQPLPAGALRDRLEALARRLKLRFREILIWRSGGMIVNAAVMGVVAPLRYILITDGMLEQMDDAKIEAVFGHEAGHVKRHHISFFLLLALISACWITILSQHAQRSGLTRIDPIVVGLSVALALKWFVFFGWVSRRFERQADVYGVRTLVLAGAPCEVPCALHEPGPPPVDPRSTNRLCLSAAQLFGQTLHDVALLNGIPPQAPSWRHGSIASRARVLQQFAADPARTAAFEQGVGRIKAGILLACVASLVWAAVELRVWRALLQA